MTWYLYYNILVIDFPLNRYCDIIFFIEVAGEIEVRGQVKLKFRDVTGSPIIVTRTLVSQQKVYLQN